MLPTKSIATDHSLARRRCGYQPLSALVPSRARGKHDLATFAGVADAGKGAVATAPVTSRIQQNAAFALALMRDSTVIARVALDDQAITKTEKFFAVIRHLCVAVPEQ